MRDSIIIERTVSAPADRVFKALITPEDLVQWHHAGDGWITPYAVVDPKEGGTFKIGYSSGDGTQTFDLEAEIEKIEPPKHFSYKFDLGATERLVTIDLTPVDSGTHIKLEFDIEHTNSKELQRIGWTQHVDNLQRLLELESA